MNKAIEVLIDEQKIKHRVKELAEQIKKDYETKPLVIVGVLIGATIFLADLIRNIDMDVALDFVDISSYRDNTVSGELVFDKELTTNIKDKDILVVEDIIDTGKTMTHLIEYLNKKGAKTVKVCTLLSKPSRRISQVKIDYIGFEIEDKFVVGYGMDYAEKYRNLQYVGYIN